MSDCIHRARLSDYLDGHLDPEVREAVRLHLESEPACRCREDLSSLEELTAGLRSLEPGPAPPGGWERLEPALGRQRGGRDRRPAVAAAALLAAAAIAAFYLPRLQEREAPGESVKVESPPPATPAPPAAEETAPADSGDNLLPAVASANLLTAAAASEPPAVRVGDDLVVRYGAEIARVDRLTASLRSLPGADRDARIQAQLGQLETLRRDLLMELVLQAQARQAGPWR